MTPDPAAFERYRRSPNHKTTLPRLLLGTAIVILFWAATTVAVLFAAAYVFFTWQAAAPPSGMQGFLASPMGILTALASFTGIWIGLWIAMRWVHGEPLSALFGVGGRVSRSGFLKGLVAVLITSLVSEILLYLLQPEIARGTISLSSWLLFLVPTVALTLLQTSSEEMLFRGYAFQVLARSIGAFATVLPMGVLFGLAHLNNQNVTWLGVANTMGWGVLFGVAFLRSGDLWLPIGLHFGWNWVLPLMGVNLSGFTMDLTGRSLHSSWSVLWSGGAYGPEGGLLTSLVVAGLFYYIWKAPIQHQDALLLRPEEVDAI